MGRAVLPTLLTVGVAVCACSPQGRSTATSSAEDSLAIIQLRERFSAAINSGDIEALLTTVDGSLVAMPPDGGELLGPEGLRSALEPSFEKFHWEATYPSVETRVAGDWAFDRGSYELALVPREGGEPIRTEGKRLWLLTRRGDGTWRISHIMFSQSVVP